jgi:hypothetical protein
MLLGFRKTACGTTPIEYIKFEDREQYWEFAPGIFKTAPFFGNIFDGQCKRAIDKINVKLYI